MLLVFIISGLDWNRNLCCSIISLFSFLPSPSHHSIPSPHFLQCSQKGATPDKVWEIDVFIFRADCRSSGCSKVTGGAEGPVASGRELADCQKGGGAGGIIPGAVQQHLHTVSPEPALLGSPCSSFGRSLSFLPYPQTGLHSPHLLCLGRQSLWPNSWRPDSLQSSRGWPWRLGLGHTEPQRCQNLLFRHCSRRASFQLFCSRTITTLKCEKVGDTGLSLTPARCMSWGTVFQSRLVR